MQNKEYIKKLFCFAVAIFFTFTQAIMGQPLRQGAPYIRNYTSKEINGGGAEVFCWARDKRGMVYTGNVAGIAEFNGREWKQIKNANNSVVRDIVVDSSGRIFVGASNDFGLLQPDSSGNMIFQSLAKPVIDQGINFNDIWEIVPTSHGIYFCSNKYVFKYNNKKISVIPVDFIVQDIYPVNNKLYVPTRTGTFLLQDTTLVPVSKNISFWLTPWKGGDQLLTISNKLELATIDISTFEIKPFESPVQEILKEEKPFEIDRIDDKYFLVATLTNKIIILSNEGDIVQIIDNQTGLMNGAIYKVYIDSDKNLWACMSKGIAKIDISYPVLKFGEDQNVTSNVLNSCFFNGIRYIGTFDGIYYLPPFDCSKPNDHSKFIRMDIATHECWEFKVFNNQLYAVCSEGLCLITGTSAKFIYEIKSAERGRRLGISSRFNDVVFLALKDKLLALKLGSGSKGKNRVVEIYEFPGIKKSISKIISDKTGNLWINTHYDGVYFLRFFDDDYKNYQVTLLGERNGISSLENTKTYILNDSVILATGDGLFQAKFNEKQPEADSLIRFTYSNFFGDTITDSFARIVQAGKESYLISGNRIYSAIRNGGREAFDYDSFSRLSCAVENLSFGSDSIAGICSDEGLYNYVLNADARDYTKSFNTLLSKVVLDGDSTIFGGCFYTPAGDSTKIPSLFQQKEYIPTIGYKFKTLTFHVAALFYEDPESTEFQYQLDGFDNEWGNLSTDNKITYTRLPSGTYTFKAKAKNVYGAYSNIAEYKFIVETPWFMSWWAYIFYVLVSGGFLYLFITLYTQNLQRQKKQLDLIIEDRTQEIKDQALQLKEMNAKLIEIDKYKQGLNNMIVHDLKNPINAIINLSELGHDSLYEIIKQAGTQMLNMVSNILDVSKYADTKLPVNYKKQRLCGISQNAISQVLFLSNHKNITIEDNIPVHLVVNADSELIERVLVNILTNSIKFSPNNSIISIHAEDEELADVKKGYVKISVADYGIGIAADKVHLLFQKFSQVVEQNSGSIKSTGLGLAFCKIAIEAHGGEIGVKSELNKGSVFWFTLPAASSDNVIYYNENQSEVPDRSKKLSEESKLYLHNYFKELQEIEFYEVSEIFSILNRIETTDKEIIMWKNNIIQATNAGNEEMYKQLIFNIID